MKWCAKWCAKRCAKWCAEWCACTTPSTRLRTTLRTTSNTGLRTKKPANVNACTPSSTYHCQVCPLYPIGLRGVNSLLRTSEVEEDASDCPGLAGPADMSRWQIVSTLGIGLWKPLDEYDPCCWLGLATVWPIGGVELSATGTLWIVYRVLQPLLGQVRILRVTACQVRSSSCLNHRQRALWSQK